MFDSIVQLFDIGQFLCRGNNANIQVGSIDGLDSATGLTTATKKIQECLLRLKKKEER
jgi:hypothetical protein